MKKIKLKRTAATTMPGYVNGNGQVVIADTGAPSDTFPGQRVYRMRCRHCRFEYGSNGCDIHARLCPAHGNGTPGEPLHDPGPRLFD